MMVSLSSHQRYTPSSSRQKLVVMLLLFVTTTMTTTTTTTTTKCHAFSTPPCRSTSFRLPSTTCPSSSRSSFQCEVTNIPRGGGGGGGRSKSDSTSSVRMSSALSSSSLSSNEIRNDDTRKVLTASVIVGMVTATMGFLYGKILSFCVKHVWTTFPSLLQQHSVLPFLVAHPKYIILLTCTLGGTFMGILSSLLPNTFTVADFVHAFSASSKDAQNLPPSRSNLLPLLLLSLVTSTFGFSVGPEAPMVCAGALVGSSLGRQLLYKTKTATTTNDDDTTTAATVVGGIPSSTLAYAGAAGALTAFMGIPIAGSIFALELPKATAGFASHNNEALSPAVAASVAALMVIRAVLVPSKTVGGHFAYNAATTTATNSALVLGGRSMIVAALGSGIGGAVLGTLFHKLVSFLKHQVFWKVSSSGGGGGDTTNNQKPTPTQKKKWKYEVLVKTTIGLLVGCISMMYPQTLFWGEGSLQCMIDGQQTSFEATKHGLASWLTSGAKVSPNVPFTTAWGATQVGIAKLVSIALACAGKFPGGIIFPLFFAAAPFAHALSLGGLFSSGGALLPVVVMCFMAATQASVTRTPLATAFILTLSASANTELSVMLPACLLSSYTGVWVSQFLSKNSYFKYNNNVDNNNAN